MTRSTSYQSDFLGQSRNSPSGLAIVICLHAVAIAAALLAKSGAIPILPIVEPPVLIDIRPIDDPLPLPPDPAIETPAPPPPVTLTPVPLPPIRVTSIDPPVLQPTPPLPPTPIALDPVLVEARIHPSYRGALQPHYPGVLLRQDVEGSCTIRVRIGTNGRVIATEAVHATHPAFCEATQRQALRRWRFEPATRDGVPVESWQQHVVEFRIT